MPSQYGFCTNTARCQLAKQRERIFIPSDGKCPQCAQPLIPEDMSRRRIRVFPLLFLLLVVGAASYFGYQWWGSQRGKGGPVARPTPVPSATSEGPEDISDNPATTQVFEDPENNPEQVRKKAIKGEVLARIDKYPKLTEVEPEQKEKLYNLVNKARAIGCIMIIPFAEGQDKLNDKEKELLLRAAQTKSIQKLTEDPTMLFFVLGYADKVGDTGKKTDLSKSRSNSVLNTLRDDAGISNLMYPVPMGSTDMFDDAAAVRNRRVEVWVVFPQ